MNLEICKDNISVEDTVLLAFTDVSYCIPKSYLRKCILFILDTTDMQ